MVGDDAMGGGALALGFTPVAASLAAIRVRKRSTS